MRNFVSFEWEIGNREHLTRDFFFSSKMPQDLLEAMTTFSIINPLLFLQQEFLNNSDDVSYVNINVQVCVFFEKAVCFEFLKYSSNIA